MRGRPKGTSSQVSTTPAGLLLSKARTKNRLGLKDVAQVLGISVQQLYNMESGCSPIPVKYVGKLSLILNLNVKTLATANFKSSAAYRKFAMVSA